MGALNDAFSIVSPTLDEKGISSNLYMHSSAPLGFLYLYSTNLASETATKIPVQSAENGNVLINPDKLKKGLVGLDKTESVELTLNEQGLLTVKSGKVKFSLTTHSSARELEARMKAIPSKGDVLATIPVVGLVEFIKRSIFCIPNDQTGQRAYLSAMQLHSTDTTEEAYATDGTIATHLSTPKQGKGSLSAGLLIPNVALQSLLTIATKRKAGETVSIIPTENKNKVFFRFADGTHFGTLTLSTQYPNLKPVLDRKTDYTFEVPKEELKQSLTRAAAFTASSSDLSVIELEISNEALVLRANGNDKLSDSISITHKVGKPEQPTKLGMNIKNLLNVISVSKSEFVTLSYSKENEPLIIEDTSGEEDEKISIKYVMMGVKL